MGSPCFQIGRQSRDVMAMHQPAPRIQHTLDVCCGQSNMCRHEPNDIVTARRQRLSFPILPDLRPLLLYGAVRHLDTHRELRRRPPLAAEQPGWDKSVSKRCASGASKPAKPNA